MTRFDQFLRERRYLHNLGERSSRGTTRLQPMLGPSLVGNPEHIVTAASEPSL